MAQVIIRNLDDRIVSVLKSRAERENKSLEQSLRDILADAAFGSSEELVEEAARIRAMSPLSDIDSTDLIRRDRDAR